RASPDARAGIALPARLTRRPRTASLSIERHREDTRRRGLANATRPREKVSVRPPSPRHGPTQRGRHVILHEEVGKALGTVFAGESDHLLKSNGSAEWGVRSAECQGELRAARTRIATPHSAFHTPHCSRMPQAPRSDARHRLALLPARA